MLTVKKTRWISNLYTRLQSPPRTSPRGSVIQMRRSRCASAWITCSRPSPSRSPTPRHDARQEEPSTARLHLRQTNFATPGSIYRRGAQSPPRTAANACTASRPISTGRTSGKLLENKDTAVFGFGIASLTGVDIFPGGGGGSSTDVNSSREVAASSGLGAAALRKACAEGAVAAELLAAQRTSYAAAVADAAKRGITPGLTPIRSNPRTVNRDGNEKEVRYAAMGTVRRCETSQLCRRTLANARIVSALSPMETTKDKGSRGRHEAHLYAGSIGGSIVEGSQVAKDFTREGSGLSIAVGLDAPFETVATGPFHAHFVAACGAVERALRSSGTLTTSTKDSESKDFIQSSSLNSNADEKKKSRWMSPPTSPGSKKKRTIDASDDVDRCSAAAAARVMLAASRTVRGGDALEFVLTMFPPEDGEFILIII